MPLKEDERFVRVNKVEIKKLWQVKGLGKLKFAEMAGLDPRALRKLERDGLLLPKYIPGVRTVLDLDEEAFKRLIESDGPPSISTKGYTWDDFKAGAKKVAGLAFEKFGADAVLTFPSTSLVFLGLVLGMLSPGDAIRTKVYTTILVAGDIPNVPDGFERAPADQYTILVPAQALGDPSKRIVVIDDFITSGGAMEALRRFFQKKKYSPDNYRFACCVCYDGLYARTDEQAKMPDFVGREPYETKRVFGLPWGKDSVTFEEALKQTPTLKQYIEAAGLQAKGPVR